MRKFRFRAAAALSLRRKEEQTALTALSRAEAEFQRVRDRRDEVEASRLDAMKAQLEHERAGTDGAGIVWHRTWISQLVATALRLGQELEARARVVASAKAAWYEARRKRRALERMRERAWQRFRQEEDRQERLVIDELARLRFLLPEFGGATSERHRNEPDRQSRARNERDDERPNRLDDRKRLPGIDRAG